MAELEYKMNIAGLERSLPLCKLNDERFIAGFVILGDPELSEATASELLRKAPEFDYLLTAEAKGIPLIHEMARMHGDSKYFVARKVPKLYMQGLFEVDVESITTAGSQKLYLDEVEAGMINGKKILIVDDVVSTGGSLKALEKLTEAAGGIIAGRMFILAEGDAIGREDIIYLEELPLFDAAGNPVS